jgi:hypothetical protein
MAAVVGEVRGAVSGVSLMIPSTPRVEWRESFVKNVLRTHFVVCGDQAAG